MYPITSVDLGAAIEVEPLGTKPKFWYRDGDQLVLFKADDRGTGEDWAEKVACELAAMLGIPHVHYELARGLPSEVPGVVCRNFAPPPHELVLGNSLLAFWDSGYPAGAVRKYGTREHTVDVVGQLLVEWPEPPQPHWTQSMPGGIESALDVFTGFVMLDAWIANQDRHHENWGGIIVDRTLHLAPSFDHGAALARNISDREREERLSTRDRNRQVPRFARRARSAFYERKDASRPMSTYAAWTAFSRKAPKAATLWLRQLETIDDTAVESVLEQIPPSRMTPICREFTLRLLAENRRRLLNGDDA